MEILSGYKNFHIFTQNQNAMYQYRAKLKRVVDGDTIDAIIHTGLGFGFRPVRCVHEAANAVRSDSLG
jgi:hypothetical protein